MGKPDPDFGFMRYNGIDAWNCTQDFVFPHPNTQKLTAHVWADENGPTEEQRETFRLLKKSYHKLWPEIALAVAQVHDSLKTFEAVASEMSPSMAVHLGEYDELSVEFVVALRNEGFRAYFVLIEDGHIEDVKVAE